MMSDIMAFIAVMISAFTLWITWKKWSLVQKKIAMITDYSKASEVLPAWYTGRMMSDLWQFGLLTVDSGVIAIRQIKSISDDGKWMDVELLTKDEVPKGINEHFVTAICDDRRSASIQIDKIILAYELISS